MTDATPEQMNEANDRAKALAMKMHDTIEAFYPQGALSTYEVTVALTSMLGSLISILPTSELKAKSVAFVFAQITRDVTANVKPRAAGLH